MRVSQKQVRQRLKTVIDPELGVNIVDLGLVYNVELKMEKGKLRIVVVMTLTSPGCPLAGMFEAVVKDAVSKIKGVEPADIEVQLTFEPPWTPEMMAEAARAELEVFL